MNKNAHDFARELTAIVDASAKALETLNLVLQQQQQSILALASEGSVSAPSLTSAKVSPPDSATGAAPEAGAVSTASPEALLAQAEQSSKALLDHAPEVAIANLYQASVHSVGLAMMNTVAAQQQLNIIAQAVVTRGAANQLSVPHAPASAPASKPTSAAASDPGRKQAQGARAR